MKCRAHYNRITRNVWITDSNGEVIARTTPKPHQRIDHAAAELMNQYGLMRTSDWLLVADGSPMRYAECVTRDVR